MLESAPAKEEREASNQKEDYDCLRIGAKLTLKRVSAEKKADKGDGKIPIAPLTGARAISKILGLMDGWEPEAVRDYAEIVAALETALAGQPEGQGSSFKSVHVREGEDPQKAAVRLLLCLTSEEVSRLAQHLLWQIGQDKSLELTYQFITFNHGENEATFHTASQVVEKAKDRGLVDPVAAGIAAARLPADALQRQTEPVPSFLAGYRAQAIKMIKAGQPFMDQKRELSDLGIFNATMELAEEETQSGAFVRSDQLKILSSVLQEKAFGDKHPGFQSESLLWSMAQMAKIDS